jgi:lysozyme
MGTFNGAGLTLLEKAEGCRLTSYPDQAGIWTIGYGHTGPEVVPGLVWTQDHANQVLDEDVERFSSGVAKLVPAALSDNQFSALVVFAYNIGLAAFAASTAHRLANTGPLSGVPDALLLWDKVHDPTTGELVVSNGLVKRRQMEIALWNTPAADGTTIV